MELHWTAPSHTTDGLDLVDPKPVLTVAEICRDLPTAVPRGAATAVPPCTPVLHEAGHPGESAAVDTLPPSLTAATARGSAVAYRIRVLNGSGRSAAPSARVLVPLGPSLEQVAGFRATQNRSGVVLEWNQEGEGDVEVLRSLDPAFTAASAPSRKPAAQKDLIQGRHAELNTTVILHVDPAAPGQDHRVSGLHGMLDRSALPNAIYLYRAERVRRVVVGGGSILIHSELTPAIQVTMRDIFPPHTPSGLASLPGSVRSGSGVARPAIDLSWRANTEADLAGYFVYRIDLGPTTPGAELRKLTAAPLPGPAYRDTDVLSGERYEYRVTAIDVNGNESKPGAAVVDSPARPF